MIRILHISDGCEPSSQVFKIHKALLSAGFISYVCTASRSIDVPNRLKNNLYVRLGYAAFNRIGSMAARIFDRPFWFGYGVLPIQRIASNLDFDIVHLHVSKSGFFDWYSLEKYQRPVVITLHDLWPIYAAASFPYFENEEIPSAPESRSYKLLDRYHINRKRAILARANIYVTAPSQFCAQHFLNTRLSSKTVTIIPNYVDSMHRASVGATKRDRRSSINIGLIASRLTPEKNLQEFVALRRVLDRENVRFVGCGRFDSRFDFHLRMGPLSTDDMMKFYSEIDILFIPSFFESFSQSALEAIMCGVKVIYTHRTAISELGEEGVQILRIDINDAQLMKSLRLLLDHRQALPGTSFQRSLAFNDVSITEQWTKLYANILSGRSI